VGRPGGIDLRTLIIASAASAAAAVVVSQFWIRGTPIAAAVTPVIVALVSELLHRPTERIARQMTRDMPAIGDAPAEPLPEASAAAPPPASEERAPRVAPDDEPGLAGEQRMRVYRSKGSRRRFAWGVALVTGLLAFAIAAAALTIPELIAGQSLVSPDRRTTLGGRERQPPDEQPPAADERPDRTVTETVPAEPDPEPDAEREPPGSREPPETAPGDTTTETTPTTPEPTETAPPGSGSLGTETAPSG
jgi:hypothetical protein